MAKQTSVIPKTFGFMDLVRSHAEYEDSLPLACWCGRWPDQPHLLCHAVVLAKRLLERFGDPDQ